ncbi:serine/threonine-protein kinase Chk1-like [Amphiura filiformis]|uniref:serine/threonine-protein kinase Chk1-like n=1 Tax=Amphiura filiformis TaxID=82378 RepID=UPI003B21E12C
MEKKKKARNLENILIQERSERQKDNARLNDDIHRLRKELEDAKRRVSVLADRLAHEQTIRYRAVQEVVKVKPQTNSHIPKLDNSQLVDMNKTLGTGTFARVRVYQLQEEQVAVKICTKNPAKLTTVDLNASIIREANMMISFRPHPNIVHFRGYVQDVGHLRNSISTGISLVMDYVPGKSLWTLIKMASKDHRKRELHPWRNIMKDAADGLNFLHEMGILHNDIKEDNILIRQADNRPVIIDFGKATFRDNPTWKKYELSDEEEIKEWQNDYPWIAPELLEDKVEPSILTDSYSFGFVCCSVYEKTRSKDERLKSVWECLLRSHDRLTLLAVMHLLQ